MSRRYHSQQHRSPTAASGAASPSNYYSTRNKTDNDVGIDEGEVLEQPENPRKRSRENDDKEAERRQRMARLRAENEQEERVFSKRMEQGGGTAETSQRTKKGESHDNPDNTTSNNIDEEDEDEEDEAQMERLLGISGFGSTKGEKVQDNHSTLAKGAAAKHKARKYRQYMNRKNGFNRPLDPMD